MRLLSGSKLINLIGFSRFWTPFFIKISKSLSLKLFTIRFQTKTSQHKLRGLVLTKSFVNRHQNLVLVFMSFKFFINIRDISRVFLNRNGSEETQGE